MKSTVHFLVRFSFGAIRKGVCFAVVALAIVLATGALPVRAAESQPDWQVSKREGEGSLLLVRGQRVLLLKGSPYEMGLQHGRLLAKEVAEDVRAYVSEWAVTKARVSRAELGRIFDSLKPFIPKRYMEEMRGLAEGSGVSLRDIHLFHALPSRFHCTGAAAFGKATVDRALYHTRSLDYSIEIGAKKTIQENAVVIVYRPEEGYAHAVLSWAGIIGCVSGMNVTGISVGEMGNACRDESYAGMPMILMLRELLRTCNSLDEAVEFVRSAPRTCGFTFIVGDGKIPSACALEVSHSRIAVGLPGDAKSSPPPHFPIPFVVRRGNHFVDEKMAAVQRDVYDPEISSPESWLAYSVMSRFLLDSHGRLDAVKMIEMLRKYPPEHGCLHQAVFCPSTLDFWVANAAAPSSADYPGAQNQPFYRYNLPKLVQEVSFDAEVAEPSVRGAEQLPPPESGSVSVSENKDLLAESSLARFRLKRKSFPWAMTYESATDDYFVGNLSFPSEIRTPYPEANTVLGEYYQPRRSGRVPGIIVLDILEGNFIVARSVARTLARNGIAALALHMPFFGKRRPTHDRTMRMLSVDIPTALAVSTQAVVDIRSAAVWLRTRKEVDPDKTGVVGVSLGAVIGALTIGVDGSFARNALVMGGGDLAQIIWTAPETRQLRAQLLENGYTLPKLREELMPIDPLTYARRITPRTVIMFNGEKDRTVPRECATQFWEKAGRPKLVWYNTTHLGMALHADKVLAQVVAFIQGQD